MKNNALNIHFRFPNPLKLYNLKDHEHFESKVLASTTARLLRVNGKDVEPYLAESWDISQDKTQCKFHIRKDAVYSDGSPIASHDVLWNFKRHILLEGQYSQVLKTTLIDGDKLSSYSDSIEGLQTPDDHTFLIKLKKPLHNMFMYFSMIGFGIFKKEDCSHEQDLITNPTFTASGTYQIEEFTKDAVTFKLVENHWILKHDKAPRKVILSNKNGSDFEAFKAGKNEQTSNSCAMLRHQGFDLDKLNKVDLGCTSFNLSPDFNGPLLKKNPHFAAKLLKVLSSERFCEITREKFDLHVNPENYVHCGVKKLLAEKIDISQKEKDQVLKEFQQNQYEVVVAYVENRKQYAEALKIQFAELGLRLKLIEMPAMEAYSTIRNGDYDFLMGGSFSEPNEPAVVIPFLINSEPKHLNLDGDHPIYDFIHRPTEAETFEEHIEVIKEFNEANLKYGIVIPLYSVNFYYVFSDRVDCSLLKPYEVGWWYSDLMMKQKGH